jgi:glycosyltransferase involved in cell wall biosynthesis
MSPVPVPAPVPAPIRVHRVIARLNTGGPAMHVVHLTEDLAAHGFETRLVAGAITPDEGDMSYYAAERGVEVHVVTGMTRLLSLTGDVRALWQLYRLFRRERPLIVHTHTAKAGTLGRVAAVLAGVPIRIHTYHGHVLGGSYFGALKTAVFLWIERQLARVSQRLVVLSDDQKREMASELGVAAEDRFATIRLGLELDEFARVDSRACREKLRSQLDIGPDVFVVGMVGRMVPVKNHELFFDAFAQLRRSGRSVQAVVVGAGERETTLRALADEAGLAESVHWLGWRDDLPAVLPAFDALALTSHDEGTPVAVIEALVAQVPVVARSVGGVSEILGRGRYGTVVDSADPTAFAEALAALADAPPHSDAPPDGDVLEEGRDWALRAFSREGLAEHIAELYRYELARAELPS